MTGNSLWECSRGANSTNYALYYRPNNKTALIQFVVDFWDYK